MDDNTLHPFELCVQIVSDDGETRLDHEDYRLSRDDLRVLKFYLDEYLEERSTYSQQPT